MIITDLLKRNAELYPEEVCLVEINPEAQPRPVTWSEYELIESSRYEGFRDEITWKEFDKRANRFANLLLTRGIKKGDKVAILLMNCLEWLPIYFGVLRTGAVVVPMNYRYTGEEIKYCLDLAEANTLVFGPEFVGRVESVFNRLRKIKNFFYVGDDIFRQARRASRRRYCMRTERYTHLV